MDLEIVRRINSLPSSLVGSAEKIPVRELISSLNIYLKHWGGLLATANIAVGQQISAREGKMLRRDA